MATGAVQKRAIIEVMDQLGGGNYALVTMF